MPSIAPLVAAVQRRLHNLPGPVRGSGEASNGEPVQVELLVAGVWVDITSYTLVRDDSGRISITSGIRDEGSQTQAAQSSLELANTDGRFSPRNPVGDYYGILSWRNAQIRISVPDGNGGKKYLIWGEASEWAPNWDSTGNSVWTDVQVNGILQRLAQGPAPERSIIYRAITDPLLTGTVAYWPCEDPTGSIELKSALTNGSPMTWTGVPVLAAYEGFGASDPLPTLTGASLSGGVARYDTTSVTQYQARYLLAVPTTGFSDLDVLSRITVDQGAYNLKYLDIHYNDPPGGVGSYGGRGTLTILLKDGDQADLATSGTSSISLDTRGRLLRVSLEVSNNGTALAVSLRILDIDTGVEDSTTVGLVTTQVTRVTDISMAPATLAGSAGVINAAVGHVLLQTTITDIDDLGRAIQPTGEAAGRRIQRLCGEEAVAFEWSGDLDDTVAMGPQGKANLLTLVQECVQADGGFLYETTAQLGLGYRTRASLYNQDPALVLSYTGFNLADIPVPVSDDRYVQNRVVVTVSGVSQTYEETSGALGTSTIGVYGENNGITLNLATTDADTLRDQAAWRVRIGTVDAERYPKISVNLAHPSMTPELKRAILGLRIADRMQLTGMPSWLAPDTVEQLIIGTDRSLNRFVHEITFTCMPAAPYNQIGIIDDADARIDIDTQLLTAAGSADTSLVVVPSAGESFLWTEDSADWPFDVRLGGEVVTVTTVGQVLNANPTFDTDLSNWTATNGTLTRVTSQAKHGAASALLTTGAGSNPRAESEAVAVTAGASYRAVGWLFTPETISAVGVNVNWFDSGSVYLSTDSNAAVATAGAWVLYDATFTAPVGAASATVLFTVSGTPGANLLLYADDVKLIPTSTYTASPQTLTVTRSVNGVSKAHSADTPVVLAYPTYIAP